MSTVPGSVLVCPQEFKGSLSAYQACHAISQAVRKLLPMASVIEQPMADGGPGTVSIISQSLQGKVIQKQVTGPFGSPRLATYSIIEKDDSTSIAVIEQASVTALADETPNSLDPTVATSYGVGELILDALERGIEEIILGVGGTCTNDGGAGAAQALGLTLLDPAGVELPSHPLHLVRLDQIIPLSDAGVQSARLRIAVDVLNQLLGPTGATTIFGPQKGLKDWQAPALEDSLTVFADRIHKTFDIDVVNINGTGAGGGLPCGLIAAIPNTTIQSGAELIADTVGLSQQITEADLVITGEGSLDAQTSFGKAVSHVLSIASDANTPCLGVAGIVEERPSSMADAEGLVAAHSNSREREAAMADASSRTTKATETLLKRYLAL